MTAETFKTKLKGKITNRIYDNIGYYIKMERITESS